MSRWDVRKPDDERALAILRTLAAGEQPKRVARELLRLSRSVDVDAEIATEAVHLAAEATTDDSYESAVAAWTELLQAHDSRTSGARNLTLTESIRFGRAAAIQRFSMRVTAVAG